MLVAGAARDADLSRDARPRPKRPEVMITTASTGAGVPELLAALDRHRAALRERQGEGQADSEGSETSVAGARGAPARLARAEAQVWAVVADRLQERLHDPAHRRATAATLADVADHRLDPYSAADRLLSGLLADRSRTN
jgi:LAO/AO transport system kinase